MSFTLIPVVQLAAMASARGCRQQQLLKLVTRRALFQRASSPLLQHWEGNARCDLRPASSAGQHLIFEPSTLSVVCCFPPS